MPFQRGMAVCQITSSLSTCFREPKKWQKEPVPGSGTGSGFIVDGLPAEVEKAKGVQDRHEDSAENIEDSVEHSSFPPFLNITLVNVNITHPAGSDNTAGLLLYCKKVITDRSRKP